MSEGAGLEPKHAVRKLKRRNLSLLMLIGRESVTSFFRPKFRKFGLSEQQWRIMRVLYEGGEMTMGPLAEQTFIVSPSLSGILKRMLEAQLIIRRVDALDTRRVVIALSPGGREKFEALVPHIRRGYRELESAIGAEDIDKLYELMERVVAKIEKSSSVPLAGESVGLDAG